MSVDLRLLCSECGKLKIKTSSGACCPDGHGRITPGITAEELRSAAEYMKKEAWLQTLESIASTHGGWHRGEGRYRQVQWLDYSDIKAIPRPSVPNFAKPNDGCKLFKITNKDGKVRVRQFIPYVPVKKKVKAKFNASVVSQGND